MLTKELLVTQTPEHQPVKERMMKKKTSCNRLGVDLNLTIKISFDMISIKRKKEKYFLFLINSRFSHLFMNFYLRQRISLKNCSSYIAPWWPKMSSDYDHKRYLSLIWSSSASLLDNRGVSSCGSPLAVSALPSSLASQSNTTSTV